MREEDFPAELREAVRDISRVWAERPDDPGVLYQVGWLLAQAGRRDEAIAALRRMAETHAGLHPRSRNFPKLVDDPAFRQLVEQIRAENPPVNRARVAFTIEESDLLPEGIAWSQRTRRFYLGSFKRKIVALDEKGRMTELVRPGQGGLGVVIGIRVDDKRGELWAVSEKIDQQPADAVTGIFRFRLSDGSLLGRYSVGPEMGSLINDLVVAPDGSVYVTSTNNGALLRIAPGSDRAETFLPPRTLPDPNGVTITPDGRFLLVAGWYGVVRVDLRDRTTRLLEQPRNISAGCMDGLYFHRGHLLGVQNCVHESGRVVRLQLDPALQRIERLTVLESYNPLFDGVTTAAIAGKHLYFIANVQFSKTQGGKPRPGVQLDPLKVLKLLLD